MNGPCSTGPLVLRGRVLTFNGDPAAVGENAAVSYWEHGIVVIDGGLIVSVGDDESVISSLTDEISIHDYGDQLILPGFVDGHVHYPQIDVIASQGAKLIDWLNDYTFPEESRFFDRGIAHAAARHFIDELTRNGFTTAAVFCTVHPESVDAYFEESERRGLRMIAGKVLMDRNAPEKLRETAEESYDQSKQLIKRWHRTGRNLYAVTPRFAVTSSAEQLEVAAALFKEFDGTYLQSHVAEDAREVELVKELFPDAKSYLDVYDGFGLLGPRALYGHGVHFSNDEIARAAETGITVVHCPTSNLFLGSGLFEFRKLSDAGVIVALGTDVGGGTSLSPFATMKGAYQIARFYDDVLTPLEMFYMATLGGARALHLGDKIGRLAPGYEADITVIDTKSTPLIAQRSGRAERLSELLFAQMILADDRAIRATYANGTIIHDRTTG